VNKINQTSIKYWQFSRQKIFDLGCTIFLALIFTGFMYIVYVAPRVSSMLAITQASAPIRPEALTLMTIKSYPLTFKVWGDRVLWIEMLRRKAADAVAGYHECDAVIISDLSESRSVFPDPVILVECGNLKRWYYYADGTLKTAD
jgi:hypothetical protein